ncbi:MAG: phosphopyruvate hydratase [Candidatus Verstraetearchaeota archaeon]|nr:phosphopyruvate hydratase [Candidatus Verstraetearchaeota archaeon]
MEKEFIIKKVYGREIIDSRGNPTVEAEVYTEKSFGRASVPSGASTGTHEAIELRDGNKRFKGKGVLKSCRNINEVIGPSIIGMDARNQKEIDEIMIKIDGTNNKSKLGANSILAVSLAVAKAAANTMGLPLFMYLNKDANILPVPLMNIINGGKHAGSKLAIQEFMIVPARFNSFKEALRAGCEIYMELRNYLKNKYGVFAINVGDEGGFVPPISNTIEALEAIENSIRELGYSNEVFLALDAAATNFYNGKEYVIDGRNLSSEELLDYYLELISKYPIILIEDPFHEEDFYSFSEITKKSKIEIVGDDIFVTNINRLKKGIENKAANSIIIKVNQIGTLTETINVVKFALENNYGIIVSHRSGETEDNYIADLAVAFGGGKIKTGAPARGERISKYNQLLRIEELLDSKARYLGLKAFKGF